MEKAVQSKPSKEINPINPNQTKQPQKTVVTNAYFPLHSLNNWKIKFCLPECVVTLNRKRYVQISNLVLNMYFSKY